MKHFLELATATNVYIVTDEEKAFLKAIREHLPNIDAYRGWNHLLDNVKYKLKKLGITNREEVATYIEDVRSLFSNQSNESYLRQLNGIFFESLRWDKVHIF